MRWLLTTIICLVSVAPAFADETLPARPIELPPVTLAAPQPINFDLVDVRQEQRQGAIPQRSDIDPHTIFQIKHHLGIAAGYDNGTPHGSIGYYITVAEWGRWNFGVPSLELGVGQY